VGVSDLNVEEDEAPKEYLAIRVKVELNNAELVTSMKSSLLHQVQQEVSRVINSQRLR
jgi:hypothetical protein